MVFSKIHNEHQQHRHHKTPNILRKPRKFTGIHSLGQPFLSPCSLNICFFPQIPTSHRFVASHRCSSQILYTFDRYSSAENTKMHACVRTVQVASPANASFPQKIKKIRTWYQGKQSDQQKEVHRVATGSLAALCLHPLGRRYFCVILRVEVPR